MNEIAYGWPGAYTIRNGEKISVSIKDFENNRNVGQSWDVFLPESEYEKYIEYLAEQDFQEWHARFTDRWKKAEPNDTEKVFLLNVKDEVLRKINSKPTNPFQKAAQRAYKELVAGFNPAYEYDKFAGDDIPAISTPATGHYRALSWVKQLDFLNKIQDGINQGKSADLSQAQIALLCFYENTPVNRNNASEIAKRHGKTSGEKLYQMYSKIQNDPQERFGVRLSVKNIETIIPFLTNEARHRAEKELSEAKKIQN